MSRSLVDVQSFYVSIACKFKTILSFIGFFLSYITDSLFDFILHCEADSKTLTLRPKPYLTCVIFSQLRIKPHYLRSMSRKLNLYFRFTMFPRTLVPY